MQINWRRSSIGILFPCRHRVNTMTMSRRQALALFASASITATMHEPAVAQAPRARRTAPAAAPDEQTVADAYIYLLGRVLVIRQERIDLKQAGIDYNVIKYNPRGSADFVNPNLDVAYLEAWFAVDDRTPVILEVPEIKGRYYTAQILDEWGEVIVNVNERTFPSKPFGKFALVKPGSTVKIPDGAGRIELHSSKAKMLARVELRDDPDGAMALQRQFKLELSGKPQIAPAVAIPDFNNKDLIGAEIFGNVDAVLASALDVSPMAAAMQQKVRFVASYVASGRDASAETGKRLREKVIPQFLNADAFKKGSFYRNNWLGGLSPGGGAVGRFGMDYGLRTAVNFLGIWGNLPEEAVYFSASRDSEDKPLDGSNSYVIHFPANQLPQSLVDAYWSISLVSLPDYRVVPNPLKRYNFNNHSGLVQDADGSLKIAVGPKAVAGVPESNRLPSAVGKPLSLTFRAYVPKDVVTRGQWSPPPITLAK